MTSSALRTLTVMTDPASVYLLDLLGEGMTALDDLATAVEGRIGTDASFVPGRLDRLAEVGLVRRPQRAHDGWRAVSVQVFHDRIADMVRVMSDLKGVDAEQASDLAAAIFAAYDTRSASRDRRRQGDVFRLSPAGRRHARRVAAGTLGLPTAAT